jgi:hypothetical protein
MSREFEDFLTEEEIKEQQLKAMLALEEEARASMVDDRDNPDNDIFSTPEGQDFIFDLKSEIHGQIMLLKAIRSHLFHLNGEPKEGTDPSDINSYMNSSMKLLSMLQSFESSLKTDSEVRRIELGIEMAMEDCPCPEFVDALTKYLEGDLI